MSGSSSPVFLQHPAAIDQITELVLNERFGVEYQPIVCTYRGEVMAYEALARFYAADGGLVSPLPVFEHIHQDLSVLSQVELSLKRMQIDYAPAGYELFLNVDPHAIPSGPDSRRDVFMDLFRQHHGLVIELIENSDIHEAEAALALHAQLKSAGLRTALDDIGADHALLSLNILSCVDYLKFDRNWFRKLHQQDSALLLRSLVGYASNTGKLTVLEGIEDESMLTTAQELGINRVQGFHFRPQFISFKP